MYERMGMTPERKAKIDARAQELLDEICRENQESGMYDDYWDPETQQWMKIKDHPFVANALAAGELVEPSWDYIPYECHEITDEDRQNSKEAMIKRGLISE